MEDEKLFNGKKKRLMMEKVRRKQDGSFSHYLLKFFLNLQFEKTKIQFWWFIWLNKKLKQEKKISFK